MKTDKILIIGACGQIGTDLTLALQELYGPANVIAADLQPANSLLKRAGTRFYQLDATDPIAILHIVKKEKIIQLFQLAAVLSASGEKNPAFAWELNMKSLIIALEIAREQQLDKIFWPSSIAVFGPGSPKLNCPQEGVTSPTTIYGITKQAGEGWCNYYFSKYGLDVRSVRYPGLISYKTKAGGGTTDYAIDIYRGAINENEYECFLSEDTRLPMLYMDDAIRGTIELMEAPAENIKVRTSYNIAGMSFTPGEVAAAIQRRQPDFTVSYAPDYRQAIADSWPASIDDSVARNNWGWSPAFDLTRMTKHMLLCIMGQREEERRKERVG